MCKSISQIRAKIKILSDVSNGAFFGNDERLLIVYDFRQKNI